MRFRSAIPFTRRYYCALLMMTRELCFELAIFTPSIQGSSDVRGECESAAAAAVVSSLFLNIYRDESKHTRSIAI